MTALEALALARAEGVSRSVSPTTVPISATDRAAKRPRLRRFRRSSLRSSPRNQAQVRSNQSISHEPKHSANVGALSLSDTFARCVTNVRDGSI
jgi:hypothetical protein